MCRPWRKHSAKDKPTIFWSALRKTDRAWTGIQNAKRRSSVNSFGAQQEYPARIIGVFFRYEFTVADL